MAYALATRSPSVRAITGVDVVNSTTVAIRLFPGAVLLVVHVPQQLVRHLQGDVTVDGVPRASGDDAEHVIGLLGGVGVHRREPVGHVLPFETRHRVRHAPEVPFFLLHVGSGLRHRMHPELMAQHAHDVADVVVLQVVGGHRDEDALGPLVDHVRRRLRRPLLQRDPATPVSEKGLDLRVAGQELQHPRGLALRFRVLERHVGERDVPVRQLAPLHHRPLHARSGISRPPGQGVTPFAEHLYNPGVARLALERQQLVRGRNGVDGIDCGTVHRGSPGWGILRADFISGVHVLTSWPEIAIIAV
jgi:hypothetical protein